MIEKFKFYQMDQCILMIEKSNMGKSKVRYFPLEQDKIEERILRRLNSKDVEVILHTDDEKINGYMELYVDNKEKYLQIYAFFFESNFKITFEQYLNYIKNNYSSYKLHYVVGDYNTDSISYMEEIKATSNGNETMLSIYRSDFNSQDTFNVTELKEEYFDQFIKLHSSLYQEVYWTGELLVQEICKFHKYVIISNDKILGFSIISNLGRDEEEIYYLYAESNDDKQQLVRYTLQESLKAASSVIILLEPSEENDFPFYEKLGFKKKEVIITYTLNL